MPSKSCRKEAAVLTLSIAIIAITPLCGQLFDCGCTWPGLGLDAKCNIHDSRALHPCPWCASLTMGLLSSALSIFAGTVAAVAPYFGFRSEFVTLTSRLILGLATFLAVAVLGGFLSAWLQNHPLP